MYKEGGFLGIQDVKRRQIGLSMSWKILLRVAPTLAPIDESLYISLFHMNILAL